MIRFWRKFVVAKKQNKTIFHSLLQYGGQTNLRKITVEILSDSA